MAIDQTVPRDKSWCKRHFFGECTGLCCSIYLLKWYFPEKNCRGAPRMRAVFHNGDPTRDLTFCTARPVLRKLKADRRLRKIAPEDICRRRSETRWGVSDLLFDCAYLISYLSSDTLLQKESIIMTGTPGADLGSRIQVINSWRSLPFGSVGTGMNPPPEVSGSENRYGSANLENQDFEEWCEVSIESPNIAKTGQLKVYLINVLFRMMQQTPRFAVILQMLSSLTYSIYDVEHALITWIPSAYVSPRPTTCFR